MSDKAKQALREQRGNDERKHDADKDAGPTESVDFARFDNGIGYAVHELAQEEYQTCAAEEPGHDKRQERIDPAETFVHKVMRNHEDSAGDHHREQYHGEERLAHSELDFRKRERRERAEEQRADSRHERSDHRIEKAGQKPRDTGIVVAVLKEQFVTLYGQSVLFADKTEFPRLRVGNRLERRDENNRERQNDQKRSDDKPGINYDITADSASAVRFMQRHNSPTFST